MNHEQQSIEKERKLPEFNQSNKQAFKFQRLTKEEANTYNLYVIIPVPDSIKGAELDKYGVVTHKKTITRIYENLLIQNSFPAGINLLKIPFVLSRETTVPIICTNYGAKSEPQPSNTMDQIDLTDDNSNGSGYAPSHREFFFLFMLLLQIHN